jgi:hypothetical protein
MPLIELYFHRPDIHEAQTFPKIFCKELFLFWIL